MYKKAVMVCIVSMVSGVGVAQAALSEPAAKDLAAEFAAAVNAATGVVGGLQQDINAGSVNAEKVKPEAIIKEFHAKFQAAAGKPFDTGAGGATGEYRAYLVKAIGDVIQANQKYLVKGGQDAFVPAYFRAQVLAKFNATFKGNVSGHVTNSKTSLINADSAPGVVLAKSPLRGEVEALLQKGDLATVDKTVGDHYMSYRPMELKEPCVTCHNRNGLHQKVGEFGGALVVDVKMR